jgi:hypothetical protein
MGTLDEEINLSKTKGAAGHGSRKVFSTKEHHK